MADFDFYTDSGLTNLVASPLSMTHAINGHSDIQIFCGGTGFTFQANSDPGNDQITVSIVGSGAQGAASIKLATTQAGLDGATAGAALDLGTEINGSTSFWLRQTDMVGVAGQYSGMKLAVNELVYS